jgi:peptidyl-prolyl cis-trans isomerase C
MTMKLVPLLHGYCQRRVSMQPPRILASPLLLCFLGLLLFKNPCHPRSSAANLCVIRRIRSIRGFSLCFPAPLRVLGCLLFTLLGLASAGLTLVHAESEIAARVNGQAVSTTEVAAEFRLAFDEAKISAADKPRLMRATLDQVINRRLVLAHLTKTSQAASKADIDLELAQFEKELKAQNLTLAEHAKKVGLTPEDIRRALAWKLSWKRYCEKHLTPQNLEKYFQQHRRDFDGTQLHVAQILFKLPPDADAATVSATKDKAAKLRQEIGGDQGPVAKEKFAAAARKYSESPSRDDGGDIGWIERHHPMPEEFSRTAFALKPAEVSQPLLSPFGVHLITVLEDKPGPKSWKDVEDDLRPATIAYLFRWLADKERTEAKIEYVSP